MVAAYVTEPACWLIGRLDDQLASVNGEMQTSMLWFLVNLAIIAGALYFLTPTSIEEQVQQVDYASKSGSFWTRSWAVQLLVCGRLARPDHISTLARCLMDLSKQLGAWDTC